MKISSINKFLRSMLTISMCIYNIQEECDCDAAEVLRVCVRTYYKTESERERELKSELCILLTSHHE